MYLKYEEEVFGSMHNIRHVSRGSAVSIFPQQLFASFPRKEKTAAGHMRQFEKVFAFCRNRPEIVIFFLLVRPQAPCVNLGPASPGPAFADFGLLGVHPDASHKALA